MEPSHLRRAQGDGEAGLRQRRKRCPTTARTSTSTSPPKGRALKAKLVPLAEAVNRDAVRGVAGRRCRNGRARVLLAVNENLRKDRAMKLRLTFACWDYDRTRALADGTRARRRHRPQLPQPAGRGDLLPHDAQPRVRRLRDVALLVHRVARLARTRRSSPSRCSRRASSATRASSSRRRAASASPRT